MKRPLAYITAPWSNNQYENAENAATYCRQVYDAGYSPICPVLFLSTFLKDEIPQEHKDGLDMVRDYCDSIFDSGAESECFFYRLGLKDGIRLWKFMKKLMKTVS
mgnify:CR=1 FL=1